MPLPPTMQQDIINSNTTKPRRCTLICDYGREKPAKYLKSTKTYRVVRKRMTIGDYAILTSKNKYAYIIERKTYADLIATLTNVRRSENHNKLLLFRKQYGADVLYIIEACEKYKSVKTMSDYYAYLTQNFIEKLMLENCQIIYTQNHLDSALVLGELADLIYKVPTIPRKIEKPCVAKTNMSKRNNKSRAVNSNDGSLSDFLSSNDPLSSTPTTTASSEPATTSKKLSSRARKTNNDKLEHRTSRSVEKYPTNNLTEYVAYSTDIVGNSNNAGTNAGVTAGTNASADTCETPRAELIDIDSDIKYLTVNQVTQHDVTQPLTHDMWQFMSHDMRQPIMHNAPLIDIPDAVDYEIMARYNITSDGLNYEQKLDICDALHKLENVLKRSGKLPRFEMSQSFMEQPVAQTNLQNSLYMCPGPLIKFDDDTQSVKSDTTTTTNLTAVASKKANTFNPRETKQKAITKLFGIRAELAAVLLEFSTADILLGKLDEDEVRNRIVAAGIPIIRGFAQMLSQRPTKEAIIKFLDEIHGVTAATAMELYNSFSPFSAIFNASITDIANIVRCNSLPIGQAMANRIYCVLHC